jgi:hypothetical protein
LRVLRLSWKSLEVRFSLDWWVFTEIMMLS